MTTPSSADVPQFRVGPETNPDRYVLGAAVSSGAEGILYRGSITTTAGVTLDVAIKMLQPRFLSRVDEWHVRWEEQVELLRSLQVPGVVPVRDGFLGPLPHLPGQPGEGQTLYLVMNWVEGETLDEWVRHRPDRNPIDDLKVLVPVAAALDLMHSGRATGGVPVVHRDIKAANVLVTEHGSVLVDFGLTRGLPDGQRLTGVVGTPGYLAPESTEAGRYSAASDRYGFGGLAYFVLTGSEPPTSHKPDVMRASLATVPELAGCPEVSDQVMAMLAADPDERPSSLANWVGQLRRSSLEADPDVLRPPAPRRLPLEPREGKTPSADSPVPSPSAARGSSDRTRDSLSKFHRFRGRRGRPVAIALAVVVLVVGSTFLAQHLLNRTTVVYVLTPGTSLNNAVVSSQNGSYHLSLLSDGNLVVTDVATGDLLWQTCSFNVKQPNYLAAYTVMKQDGLYVQQQSGSQLGKITTLWNSNTLTGPALRFVLSDQGIPEVQSHGESLGGTSAGFSKVPPASCPSSS